MKSLAAAAAGALLLATAALSAPGAASAAPALSTSVAIGSGLVPVSDGAHGIRMLSAAQAAPIITAYWTAARMAAAIKDPVIVPPPSADALAAVAEPTGKPQRVASAAAPVGAAGRLSVAFTNTDGRVFFHDPSDNSDHACSGGAVNSGKKRLAWTAGHCVHGGPGKTWMTNWAFYPGYQFGAGSAGVFPAYQLWGQSGWFNNGDNHFDYGVGITQTNASGAKLVNAVGGNGLIVNPGRPSVTAIAYPVNFNNGEQQAFCQGTLSRRNIFNSDQQLNCDLRFGASGGPWLQNYGSTGLGDMVSNQSYSLNSDGSGPEYGPYFDNDTAALYNAAEAASP